ncbi:hypothetical protein TNCV_2627601 [Trichonephila clavipes]|uniref:Uncharacterized protein n=1 Tax=Trichonephila clavipes TaxID=2585209 RepID=A0A8X6W7K3_TRICX|nr:hypothetical protein TNCV_2627601 [Trichonephila clavipes]
MTPELASLSPNYHITPIGGHLSSRQIKRASLPYTVGRKCHLLPNTRQIQAKGSSFSKPSVLPVLHLGYCCIVRITHIPCSRTNPRCSCHISLASADNYRLPKSSDAGSFGPKETEKTADRGRSS